MVYKWPSTPWAVSKALNTKEKDFVVRCSPSRVLPGFTAEGLGSYVGLLLIFEA